MMRELLGRFLPHLSSITLSFGAVIFYLLGDHEWINNYLPVNGKPLFIFMLVSIVVVYEVMLDGQKQIRKGLSVTDDNIRDLSRQMEINRLKQDVNSIYFRIKNNNVATINNENTIKEINELKDIRAKLNVNSYTESRLDYLCNMIEF